MEINGALTALALALGLGLLVGLQREKAGSPLGGARTFPLLALLGAALALVASAGGRTHTLGAAGTERAAAVAESAVPAAERAAAAGGAVPVAEGAVAVAEGAAPVAQRAAPVAETTAAPSSWAAPVSGGGWVLIAAGLAGVVLAALGAKLKNDDADAPHEKIINEVAVASVYALGVMSALAPPALTMALGVTIAALLQAKGRLHGLAERMGPQDMRAILTFAALTFVILPALPDRAMGPWGVLNPRHVWLMVVLVTGVSLAGYVLYKVLGERVGAVGAGLLGGLISSTATTVSYARRARDGSATAWGATSAIMLAGFVLYVRVGVALLVVAPGLARAGAGALGVMAGVSALAALAAVLMARRSDGDGRAAPVQANPTQLGTALVFAGLYAGVLLAVAFVRQRVGEGAMLGVAALSGLTDMDAITLSAARLFADGELEARSAVRVVLVAAVANEVFKGVLAAALGGRALAARTTGLVALKAGAGVVLLLLGV